MTSKASRAAATSSAPTSEPAATGTRRSSSFPPPSSWKRGGGRLVRRLLQQDPPGALRGLLPQPRRPVLGRGHPHPLRLPRHLWREPLESPRPELAPRACTSRADGAYGGGGHRAVGGANPDGLGGRAAGSRARSPTSWSARWPAEPEPVPTPAAQPGARGDGDGARARLCSRSAARSSSGASSPSAGDPSTRASPVQRSCSAA